MPYIQPGASANACEWVFGSEFFFKIPGSFRWLDQTQSLTCTVKVNPEKKQRLEIRLWNSPYFQVKPMGKRTLEATVEGEMIGACEIQEADGEFVSVNWPLPEELLKGKQDITISLKVPGNARSVYGISECRIVSE